MSEREREGGRQTDRQRHRVSERVTMVLCVHACMVHFHLVVNDNYFIKLKLDLYNNWNTSLPCLARG